MQTNIHSQWGNVFLAGDRYFTHTYQNTSGVDKVISLCYILYAHLSKNKYGCHFVLSLKKSGKKWLKKQNRPWRFCGMTIKLNSCLQRLWKVVDNQWMGINSRQITKASTETHSGSKEHLTLPILDKAIFKSGVEDGAIKKVLREKCAEKHGGGGERRRGRWRNGQGWTDSQRTRWRENKIKSKNNSMRIKEECDRRRERNLQWDERQIKRRIKMVSALACHGTITLALCQAGGWQVKESSSLQTFASISGWPLRVIYARCWADTVQTNIFKIHSDSFITLQKESCFRCLELIIFVLKIRMLITILQTAANIK